MLPPGKPCVSRGGLHRASIPNLFMGYTALPCCGSSRLEDPTNVARAWVIRPSRRAGKNLSPSPRVLRVPGMLVGREGGPEEPQCWNVPPCRRRDGHAGTCLLRLLACVIPSWHGNSSLLECREHPACSRSAPPHWVSSQPCLWTPLPKEDAALLHRGSRKPPHTASSHLRSALQTVTN